MKKTIILISEFTTDENRYAYANSFWNILSKNSEIYASKINCKKPHVLNILTNNNMLLFKILSFILYKIFEFCLNLKALVYICLLKPECLILIKAHVINYRLIRWLSNKKNIKIVNFYTDSPFSFWNGNSNQNILKSLPFYDTFFIWSNKFDFCLKGAGAKNTEVFNFFVEQDLFKANDFEETEKNIDICFIGDWDRKREFILNQVLLNYPNSKIFITGSNWRLAEFNSLVFLKAESKELSFIQMQKVFKNSKISLNILKDQNEGCTNMRTFEVPASGGLLLAEYSQEQADFFIPYKEACYFSNSQELIKKISFLLVNEEMRKKILSAGYEKSKYCSLKNYLNNFLKNNITK